MGSEENSMPMDDVSFSDTQPDLNAEPTQMDMPQMDNLDNQETMNPEMGAEETNTAEDDSTMGIINKLNDDDKDAVRSYAESLLKRDKGQNENGEEPTSDGLNMEAPVGGNMSESVIFTKAQLRKINENFNKEEDKLEKPLSKKEKNITNKKSPFNVPNFN